MLSAVAGAKYRYRGSNHGSRRGPGTRTDISALVLLSGWMLQGVSQGPGTEQRERYRGEAPLSLRPPGESIHPRLRDKSQKIIYGETGVPTECIATALAVYKYRARRARQVSAL